MVRRRRSFSNPDSPIDADRITGVIRGYWRKIVEAFEKAGFHETAGATRVNIQADWHDTCRHYAGARTDGKVLVVAPQIVDLGDAHIVAILAHEGGHLVDFGQPGRFYFRPARELRVRSGAVASSVFDIPEDYDLPSLFRFRELPVKGRGKHFREWRARDSDEVELVADGIASFVMGQKIGYTGKPGCLIQTMGRGIERPLGLR